MIGDGDGQMFAHRVCYHMRDMIAEALPWCSMSVRNRIYEHARRQHITLLPEDCK